MSQFPALNHGGMTTLTDTETPTQAPLLRADGQTSTRPGLMRWANVDPDLVSPAQANRPQVRTSSVLVLSVDTLAAVWAHFDRLDRDRDGRLSRDDIESVAGSGPHGTLRKLAGCIASDATTLFRIQGVSRAHVLAQIAQLVSKHFDHLALPGVPSRVSLDDLLVQRSVADPTDHARVQALQRVLLETPGLFQALASPEHGCVTLSSLGVIAPRVMTKPPVFAAGAVWRVFHALDTNRNGRITKSELTATLKRPGISKSVRALVTLLLTDRPLFDSLSRGAGFITHAGVIRECALRVKSVMSLWPRASLTRVSSADLAYLVGPKSSATTLDPSARLVAQALLSNPALYALLADQSGSITEQSLDLAIARSDRRGAT